MPKRVSFGDITIREFPMILGDNPSCSNGAPVTIDWFPQNVHTRNLDLFEYMHGERRQGRKALLIPVETRGIMLLDAGYSIDEIGDATLEIAKIKKKRADSLKSQGWDKMVLKTGKIIDGLQSVIIKPIQKSVHARTA
jgi:hypothetical protein